MAITDRFLKYLKVELNEFLGKYGEEDTQNNPTSKKKEDWTDSLYNFMNGNTAKEDEKTQQASKDQWTHRRERRSQHQSSKQQAYNDASSWQNTNTNADPEAKYYEALEIKKGASAEEIKQAYRQVMKKYHPDKFASDPEKQKYAEQLAQKINDAYDYLKKKHSI